jgi:hypothetical protein
MQKGTHNSAQMRRFKVIDIIFFELQDNCYWRNTLEIWDYLEEFMDMLDG